MKKLIIILITLVGCASIGEAQTLRQYKKEALKAFLMKDYYAALAHYDVILDVDSSNIETYYNHAESARNFNAYNTAERSYERVANSSEKANFPKTDFWLASIKKNLGKYDEASALFQRYINNASAQDETYVQAQQELEYLKWASSTIESPVDEMYIKRLGDEVNSEYNEISPFMMDNTLYYASLRFEKAKDDQYPTRHITKVLTSEEGGMGKVIENNFNSDLKHTSNVCFNSDNSRIYYTICDYAEAAKIPCEIYYRNVNSDGSWAGAVRLPEPINVIGTTSTQPNIGVNSATNQEVLYFVSDRTGGKGGHDVWYSEIDNNGNFGAPQNLATINTAMDEYTPFFHQASKTIYFSSQGHQNLGGFDVFKSQMKGAAWGEIEHLGFPLNSSYNDLYFTLNEDESKAYFASNRLGSAFIDKSREACCNDIYEVDIAPAMIDILALTFNKKTQLPLNGTSVQLIELENILKEDSKADNNEYTFGVEKYKDYVVIAKKPNYSSDTISISTADFANPETLEGKLYLRPLLVDLTAFTFDSEDNAPVRGATIKLLDCKGNFIADLTNASKNDFFFDEEINPDNCYELAISHPDYYPEKRKVTIQEIFEDTHLTENINLRKIPVTKERLDKYLPMPLYFDNDEPDKKTTRTYTSKTYPQTTSAYLARKSTFKAEYGKGLRGEQRIVTDQEIDNFFRNTVQVGIDTLLNFDDYLIRYIQQGNTAELMIRGFASPLATSSYNEALTKRRISSILNHFKSCHSGVLESFIRDGRLKITQAPFGETQAAAGISDSPSDKRNSIYSPAASLERRVEIIEIKVEGQEKLGN